MYELVYCEDRKDYDKISALILKEFPTVGIKDVSDETHECRFSVEGEIDRTVFWKFSLESGFALQVFGFHMSVMGKGVHPENYEIARKLVEEWQRKVKEKS